MDDASSFNPIQALKMDDYSEDEPFSEQISK